MSVRPFEAYPAATVSIDVSASSQRVLVGPSATSIRIYNSGIAEAFIVFGGSDVTAAVDTGMPVGPGVTEVVTYDNGLQGMVYAAAIAAGSTGKIYFTPGAGI